MKECEEFINMLEWMKNNADSVITRWSGYADGYICGHYFRMFQELAETVDGHLAPRPYVCIKTVSGSKWPAYYSIEELEDWLENIKSEEDEG